MATLDMVLRLLEVLADSTQPCTYSTPEFSRRMGLKSPKSGTTRLALRKAMDADLIRVTYDAPGGQSRRVVTITDKGYKALAEVQQVTS